MKKLILPIIMFVGCTPSAYLTTLEVPLTKEQMSHQVIIETDISKDEVFDVSLQWMAKTFVSSKAVIEYQDKSTGKIIGKGFVTMVTNTMGMSVPVQYHFTLSIEIKEGRFRLFFENFQSGTQKVAFTGLYKEELEYIDKLKVELTTLSQDLENYLTTSRDRDEW